MIQKLKGYEKAVVAVLGAAAEAVSLGLISGTAAKDVGIAIAIATALGVYGIKNSAP